MRMTDRAIPILTTARTAAFIPEQSPPLVKIASFVGLRCAPAFPLGVELEDEDPAFVAIFRVEWTKESCDRSNFEAKREY